MSRKKTTGRFDTRQELEDFVNRHWYGTKANQAQVARAARVSPGVVAQILSPSVKPATPLPDTDQSDNVQGASRETV